jgi:hypothetical protein
MHDYATKAGRTLVVWEGFAPAAGQTGRSAHPARAGVGVEVILNITLHISLVTLHAEYTGARPKR